MLRMIVRAPRRTTAIANSRPTPRPTQTNTDNRHDSNRQHDDDNTDEGDSATSDHAPTAPPTHDDETTPESLEPWVQWIKRATHDAEAAIERLRIKDWVSICEATKVEVGSKNEHNRRARMDPAGDPMDAATRPGISCKAEAGTPENEMDRRRPKPRRESYG